MSADKAATDSGRALLSTLSDDLALPLLQIKTTLELFSDLRLSKDQKTIIDSLGISTDAGLRLLEAYRLALSLADTSELPLEPVAIGAVLNDVAHQLNPLALAYETELWVDTQSSLKPALANSPSLTIALHCLAISLIRAQAAAEPHKKGRILLGAHRSEDGHIVTGVFGSVKGVGERALRSARSLGSRARQPVFGVPAGTASGVLVADMLCARMWSPLKSTHYQNLDGLATVVPISKQLNFV